MDAYLRSYPVDTRLRAGGFTLVEILMTLGLFALFAVVLIGGAISLLGGRGEVDPEDAVLAMLQEVRRAAVLSGEGVELQVLENGEAYLWTGGGTLILEGDGTVRVRLITAEMEAAVLIGGQMEERAVTRMRFYPDGTCDPVRLEVRRGDRRSVVGIDPWTAAALSSLPGGGVR